MDSSQPIPPISDISKAQEEDLSNITPQIGINVDDSDLLYILNKRVKESQDYFKTKLKLDERRRRFEDYWLGRQTDQDRLDPNYQFSHIDNIIWRDLETRISLASARLPDLIVAPGQSQGSKERAKL